MPAGFSTTAKNDMLDALTVDLASLHTGDPGAAGTSNEVSGGSPAYARQAITFAAASSGSRAASSQPLFDVPGSTTVSWVSFWTNTGTVFIGSVQLGTPETFGSQGQFRITSASLSLT
jgi:hypothetical protein